MLDHRLGISAGRWKHSDDPAETPYHQADFPSQPSQLPSLLD